MANNASYPLSPLQSGMLYQSLVGADSAEFSGFDIEQVRIDLPEPLDWDVLAKAWTEVARAHTALSSRFIWRGVGRLEQSAQTKVQVPLTIVDWSGQNPDRNRGESMRHDIDQVRKTFLRSDRRQGFRLDHAPLMRVTVALVDGGRAELYWTVHHIIIDGRSFAPVLNQVFQCYHALKAGCSWMPPSTSKAYCDYMRELGGESQSRQRTLGLSYFAQLLDGKVTPTPLPLADARAHLGAVPEYQAIEAALEAPLCEQLLRLCHHHETSVGCLLQAAWAVLLARVTGDSDVVFGVTRTCRQSVPASDSATIIGLMINTLPMRVRLNEYEPLGQLLQAVRQQWLKQRAFEQTPLQDIQARSNNGPPVRIFETLVVYDNLDLNQSLRQQDARWESRHCTVYEQPSTPLTLIGTGSERLQLKLLFDTRRFSSDNVQRLLAWLVQLLEHMVSAHTVSDLEILSPNERHHIVHHWNETARPFSDSLLIHQLFEKSVERQPNAIALDVNGETTSYLELDERSNQLAHVLRSRGARPGRFVGVCLSRGADLVVALLAITKSGAAYLPIDPAYPKERISFMIGEAAAAIVVTEEQHETLFSVDTVHLREADVRQAPHERLPAVATPGDICYCIYTSGSTGKPKGVLLTHAAVVNTLEWVSQTFGVGPGDRALFVTSPCFDLSVYDVFGILGAGATVVVATSECLREPRALVRQLTDNGITIWDSAPGALQRLTGLLPSDGGSQLRLVMLSGDWIPITLPSAIRASFGNAKVISLGGATEAAIWSNWFPIDTVDPSWTSIPYGRPIQNTQYYILDKRLRPVPVGVVGDLYISGTCVARGYLNRPELTAERFVDNPFCPGRRMYMTGDLARYFPDGNIEFLGRNDFQVKIRGYRVELGEVEATLLGLPSVREALCIAFHDVSGANALVAYLRPKTGEHLDEASVRAALSAVLPDFMVPSRIIILDELPLSANGKVDRKALPSPLSVASTDDYRAPSTDVEQRMAAIWQRLLKRERVGCNDRFLALGGDSLLAVSLVVAIEQEFGVQLPISTALSHSTMGAMAAAVHSCPARRGYLVRLNEGGTRPPLFLFPGAGGFGFFFHEVAQRLGPDQPVYALHAIGAESDEERPLYSIEEMASIYVDEINKACPTGPLLIGGYSFGALVAYAVSKQMLDAGREVPLVISFDGPAPGYPKRLPLLRRLRKHLTEWWQLETGAKRSYVQERVSNILRRIRGIENDVRLVPRGIGPDIAERLRRVAVGLWHARNRFKPQQRIQSNLLLLRTEAPLSWPGCHMNSVYGWDEYVAGRVRAERLPGTHLELFEPNNCMLIADAIHRLTSCQRDGGRSNSRSSGPLPTLELDC